MSLNLIATAQFALGRPAQALKTVDEMVTFGGEATPPFVPPDLQQPMARFFFAIANDGPIELIRTDMARIESALGSLPMLSGALRIYWMKSGDFEKAAKYSLMRPDDGQSIPIDTTGARLVGMGWEAVLRGNADAAVDVLDDGIQRLGTTDMWAFEPVLFDYARLLSERPDRRAQGIRMLRWFARRRPNLTARSWLALGKALEADGDVTGARDAYAQALRLWSRPEPYLEDSVQEARAALNRPAAEVG